jgi:hypothetical protein
MHLSMLSMAAQPPKDAGGGQKPLSNRSVSYWDNPGSSESNQMGLLPLIENKVRYTRSAGLSR